MKEKEVWKDIPGYEGLYQVNQWGDIYSLYTNRKLKWSIHKDGYKIYNLHKDKKAFIMTAHRAVALAFIPNPDNLPLINHKDEDKQNCYVENLEWCSHLYNNTYNDKQKKIQEKSLEKYAKHFYVYDLDMNLIGEFIGARKFAKENDISIGSFCSVLNHNSNFPENLHQCKGYYPIGFKL